MKKFISFLILSIACSTYLLADVFMTELTDPQNSSDAGRYVELHNNGDAVVDLSAGWSVQRWTNGNADPTSSSMVDLAGTITPGGFYIICNDADKFATTYGGTCDQDIGTGGFADSNGDDNMALLFDGSIVDMFGVPGEDGSGTGHEFEDGRAERAAGNTTASATWEESGWNVDNDSGGGDGNQYAPEGFDPGEWIGAGDAPSDVYGCMDLFGLNFNSEATADDGSCEYADHQVEAGSMYFAPADLVINMGESVQWNNVGGFHDAVADDGAFAFDACDGPCLIGSYTFVDPGTYSYICSVYGHAGMGMVGTVTVVDPTVEVTFSVDMNLQGVTGDVSVRTSTIDGDYSPSDWFAMDDSDGDLVYTYTLSLLPGVEYGYNFNDGGYESGDGLADCAGGNYGNDRYVTPGDAAMTLDTVCWESCDACPDVIPGCTDEDALNFDENATEDDGSCFYEAANLFFSEYAEGSSNNKYLEIYNASDGDVDMSGYSLSSCSNGCDDGVSWDYPDNVTFAAGTTLAAGDVYVVCHGSSDDFILAECDQTFTYLSNGDDVFGLTVVGLGTVLDVIGLVGDDPGSGWEVAGVANGTKDHTLVRKATVESGNPLWLDNMETGETGSAGTDADSSEWVVLDQNTWTYLGSHPHEFETTVYVDVTFNIDMSGVETSSDGVFIAGGMFGYPGDNPMSDDDGDDIWTFTTSIEENSGEVNYTFLNGNCSDWSCKENISGQDCACGTYNDRCLDVGADSMTVNGCFAVCGDGQCSDLDVPDTYTASFEVDGSNHSCGQINVQGSWNWGSPWGAQLTDDDGDGVYTGSLDAQFSLADGSVYEYVFLCVDTSTDGWWDDVFGNSYTINAPQGSACDFNPEDGWANYGFTVEGADVQETYCAGSCEATCEEEPSCGDGTCADDENCSTCPADCGECASQTVTFDIDGVEDCGFVSVTGSFSNWDGWGATTDTGMSIELEDGFYEFVVLCVDTSTDGWWYDIWGNSTILGAPLGSECDAVPDDEYGNYGFTVAGSDMTVSYCAGTCDETCGSEGPLASDVTFDLDGLDDCGFVSVTGTWDGWSGWGANTDTGMTASIPAGDHEFIILCVNTVDGWWYDIWGNSTVFNAPVGGECWNGDETYANYTLSVDGSGDSMTVSYCAGTCDETCEAGCMAGDVNADDTLDVLDVVSVVGGILDGTAGDPCADMNADGNVDVLDVVSMVNIILAGRSAEDATSAQININNGLVSFKSDGFVGAVQMTISHDADFSIRLTDDSMVSDYRTNGNYTTLMVVSPNTDELFIANGDFSIEEVIVANSNSLVDVVMPSSLTVGKGYPNPFNPSTTFDVYLPTEGIVNLSVYNVMGQLVDVIHSGSMTEGSHSITWNASNMTSGVYFVRAESLGSISTQKIMLMK